MMDKMTLSVAAPALLIAGFALPLLSELGQNVLVAARNGDDKVVREWLHRGGNVNDRGPGGTTLLLTAVQGNHAVTVRLLLESGADVNILDEQGYSPLLAASLLAGPDVVRQLLEHGARLVNSPARTRDLASVDLEDPYVPLFYMVVKGQIENVRRMLASGADPNHVINERPLTMSASEHDWVAVVDLLDRAARPRAESPDVVRDPFHRGYTPLMLAAAKGDAREFQRLLKAGADWKARTTSRTSLLMFAAQGGNPVIIDALLRLGAKGGEPNYMRWTPVMYAAVRGDAATVERLLRAGDDRFIPDEDAGVLVHCCLSREIRHLLENSSGNTQPPHR